VIIVVGAGVVGASTAYELARRGATVTLVDSGDLADGVSHGNAGLISAGHPPLPRPGLVRRAPRLLLDPKSPLYVPPRLDPSLWWWLLRFAAACRRPVFERSMSVLAAMGRPAVACFESIIEREGIDCDFRQRGWLEVCRTAKGLANVEEEARRLKAHGFDVEMVDAAGLRELEPAFRDDVTGAALFGDSACCDPGAFMRGLLACLPGNGVTVHQGERVERLDVDKGRIEGVTLARGDTLEAGTVVLAAGVWTPELARTAGLRMTMRPAKGYHVDLTGVELPSRGCVLSERSVGVTPMGERLRLAGTLELGRIDTTINRRRIDMLSAGARLYLRDVENAEVDGEWCGLRPCTADGLPVVGAVPGVEGLHIATGHAMLGFTLGPLTGRLLAESILEQRPSIDIGALSPARSV
jgi:D-amino-acid dehydrogenase